MLQILKCAVLEWAKKFFLLEFFFCCKFRCLYLVNLQYCINILSTVQIKICLPFISLQYPDHLNTSIFFVTCCDQFQWNLTLSRPKFSILMSKIGPILCPVILCRTHLVLHILSECSNCEYRYHSESHSKRWILYQKSKK